MRFLKYGRSLFCMGLLFFLASSSWAADFVRIENRWKPAEQIHIQNGPLASSQTKPGWWSADWIIEAIPGTPYIRLKNRWKGIYIHNQNGKLEAGNIKPGWWSAMWQLETVPGTSFYRLKNRWRNNYIHNQNGHLDLGGIKPGWWSAMWNLKGYQPSQVAGRKTATTQPSQPQKTNTSPTKGAASTGKTTTPVMNKTAAQILGASTEPDICWKDSYGRGVGKVPSACPKGWERTGADLLCYPVCRKGFSGVGPVCWQDCPSGFRNDGAFCAKPKPYGRGAGYPWKFGDSPNDSGMFARCEKDHGKGKCEKNGLIVYPKCKRGYHNVGCCVCSPDCPSDMGTDIGVSCTKKSYGRGVGQGALCPPGQEQDFKGGLCYPKCRSGTSGVGPVCWSGCPSDYPVNCGAACGVSESACAFAIMEQVQSSAEVALNVGLLVTTAGAGNAAVKAAKVAGKSAQRNISKQLRKQLRNQAKEQVLNARKWMKRKGRVETTQGWLDKAGNLESYADMMVDAYEEGSFDFTALAPSVADVEPTGVLAVVNSFNKPICGK